MSAQDVCLSDSKWTKQVLSWLEAVDHSAKIDQRRNVTIIYSSMDGLTSNPLSWCYLRNRFPKIIFTLGVRLPYDDNHSVVPSFAYSDRPNAGSWAVYSVDILSCLCPPLRGECSRSIRADPDDTALVSCDRNTIDAHRQFISFQLASCHWRPRIRKRRLGLLSRQSSHHVWRDMCCLKEDILSVRVYLAPFKVSEVAKFTPSCQPKTFSPFQE